VLALAQAVTAAPSAWAGEAPQQLFASVDQVPKVREDPALKPADRNEARRAETRCMARAMFGCEEMARRTLGRRWHARTQGASLAATDRSQLDRVIRRSSFEQLVTQARDKR